MSASGKTQPKFERLVGRSRAAFVREQLEAAITAGEYSPGAQLPSERELSEIFGVSRVSVREAMRGLEAVGLVDIQHGSGCFVTDPMLAHRRELNRWIHVHRDEIQDLLLVRGALDQLAAREAASHPDAGDIAAIREAEDAFADAATEGSDGGTLEQRDIEFHGAIAHASGSPLLESLLAQLHDHLRESRSLTLAIRGPSKASIRDHRAIVSAIERGAPEAASRATAQHIKRVSELLSKLTLDTEAEADGTTGAKRGAAKKAATAPAKTPRRRAAGK
jgi:DNA-binding FadR family transcriptional regulator